MKSKLIKTFEGYIPNDHFFFSSTINSETCVNRCVSSSTTPWQWNQLSRWFRRRRVSGSPFLFPRSRWFRFIKNAARAPRTRFVHQATRKSVLTGSIHFRRHSVACLVQITNVTSRFSPREKAKSPRSRRACSQM